MLLLFSGLFPRPCWCRQPKTSDSATLVLLAQIDMLQYSSKEKQTIVCLLTERERISTDRQQQRRHLCIYWWLSTSAHNDERRIPQDVPSASGFLLVQHRHLINHLTAVTFSMNLGVVHEKPTLEIPWKCTIFCQFVYGDFLHCCGQKRHFSLFLLPNCSNQQLIHHVINCHNPLISMG